MLHLTGDNNLIIRPTTTSMPKIKTPKIKTTDKTIPVCFIVLPKDGQVTFLSSPKVSLILLLFGAAAVVLSFFCFFCCLTAFASTLVSTFSCDSSFSSEFDLDRWISEHCSHVSGPEKWKDGRKWVFDVCPFNSDHNNRSAVITQQANGAISFTCHHNGCKDK